MIPISPSGSSTGVSGFTVHQAHSSSSSFPVMAISIIGILATTILLLSYYLFVIRCCVHWHRIDILYRFSVERDRPREASSVGQSPGRMEGARGLDEAAIRAIPIFKFKESSVMDVPKCAIDRSYCECAVCLNDFKEDERLRMIPNCCHLFHLDCIDVWLQNSTNCPLCRTSISGKPRLFPFSHMTAPASSLRVPVGARSGQNFDAAGHNEHDVVIELVDHSSPGPALETETTLRALSQPELQAAAELRAGYSWKTFQTRKPSKKIGNKLCKVRSRGDECIDTRDQDDEFAVEPMKRSFSFDSSEDRRLLLAVRDVVQRRQEAEILRAGAAYSSRRNLSGRSFFSFGSLSKASSRSSILPQ